MTESIVQSNNVRPLKNRSKRRGWVMLAFLIAVLAGVGAGAFFMLAPDQNQYTLTSYQTATVTTAAFARVVEGSGEVRLPTRMELTSPEEGYSAQLLVKEGDSVGKNEPLGSLDVPDLEDSLEDIELDLIDARANLRRTIQQNEITIDRMKRALARLEEAVVDAEEEVRRLEALVQINASRESELEDAQDKLEDAIRDRDEQIVQIEEQSTLNEHEIEALEFKIQELVLRQERMQERVADTTIRSPLTGTVLDVAEVMTVSGSKVSKGSSLFIVADPDSARVELEVSEKYADLIQPGQSVVLNVSGTEYPGSVESVGAVAELAGGSLEATVLVTVIPDSGGGSLLQGATAAGEFEVGTIQNALTLPRGAYLSTGSQRYVYVIDGDIAVKTEVVYGEIQATRVQILSGVQAGDQVIVSGYQNYIDQDAVRLATASGQ